MNTQARFSIGTLIAVAIIVVGLAVKRFVPTTRPSSVDVVPQASAVSEPTRPKPARTAESRGPLYQVREVFGNLLKRRDTLLIADADDRRDCRVAQDVVDKHAVLVTGVRNDTAFVKYRIDGHEATLPFSAIGSMDYSDLPYGVAVIAYSGSSALPKLCP